MNDSQPMNSEENKPYTRKKRHGCLIVFLIFISVLIVAALIIWKFVLNPGPGAVSKALVRTPLDHVATEAVSSRLEKSNAGKGVAAYVLPLPDQNNRPAKGQGNIVLMELNIDEGFIPAGSRQGLHSQTREIIACLIGANREDSAGITHIGCSVSGDDRTLISFSVPVEAAEAWFDGKMSDEQFLGEAAIKIEDRTYVRSLIEEYIGEKIGDAIIGKFFASTPLFHF